MKRIIPIIALGSCLAGVWAQSTPTQVKTQDTTQQTVFPLGEELHNENFSGKAWLHMLSERDVTFNCPIRNVTFEPRCRNRWHKHPGGQILLCTAGMGYYQEKGKNIHPLKEGDIVRIAPMVEHWHGASPKSWFFHLSVETNSTAGNVKWLNAVTDEEYAGTLESKQ